MAIPRKNLSAVAFYDYFRLRYKAELEGVNLYDTVRQHDKDKVQFSDIYDTLTYILQDERARMDSLYRVSTDSLGLLLSLMVQKGVITEKDGLDLVNTVLKMHTEDEKEMQNKEKDD